MTASEQAQPPSPEDNDVAAKIAPAYDVRRTIIRALALVMQPWSARLLLRLSM